MRKKELNTVGSIHQRGKLRNIIQIHKNLSSKMHMKGRKRLETRHEYPREEKVDKPLQLLHMNEVKLG